MSLQYGPSALLTGPCLETTCGQFTSSSSDLPPTSPNTTPLNCSITLAFCTAGSTSYTNPLNPINPLGLTDPTSATNCSYTLTSPPPENDLLGICSLRELTGKIAGQGNVWSLFDGSSTVVLTATALSAMQTGAENVLYVDSTVPGAFSHFFEKGRPVGSAVVVTQAGTIATTMGIAIAASELNGATSGSDPTASSAVSSEQTSTSTSGLKTATSPPNTATAVSSFVSNATSLRVGSSTAHVGGTTKVATMRIPFTTSSSTPKKGAAGRLGLRRQSLFVVGLLSWYFLCA